ncbi:hypothetical protein RCL1_006997 [Eukaryota sp. TZLM3-RCL]
MDVPPVFRSSSPSSSIKSFDHSSFCQVHHARSSSSQNPSLAQKSTASAHECLQHDHSHSDASFPITSTLIKDASDLFIKFSHIFGFNPLGGLTLLPTPTHMLLVFSVGSFIYIKADNSPASSSFLSSSLPPSLFLSGPGLTFCLTSTSFEHTISDAVPLEFTGGLRLTEDSRKILIKVFSVHQGISTFSARIWSLELFNGIISLTDVEILPLNFGVIVKKPLRVQWSLNSRFIALLFVSEKNSLKLALYSYSKQSNLIEIMSVLSLGTSGSYNDREFFDLKFNSTGTNLAVLFDSRVKIIVIGQAIRVLSLSTEGTTINQVAGQKRQSITAIGWGLFDTNQSESVEVVFLGTSDGHVFVSEKSLISINIGYLISSSIITSLSFSSNICITGNSDGSLKVWPTRPEPFSHHFVEAQTSSPVFNSSCTQDGRFAILAAFDSISTLDLPSKSHQIVHSSPSVYEFSSLPFSFSNYLSSIEGILSAISVNESKGEIAIADFHENLRIFDLDTGIFLCDFVIPGGASVIRFMTSKYELLCGTHDGTLFVLDMYQFSAKTLLKLCEGIRIVDIAIKSDELILVVDEKGRVHTIKTDGHVLRLITTNDVTFDPPFINLVSKSRYICTKFSSDFSYRLVCSTTFNRGYILETLPAFSEGLPAKEFVSFCSSDNYICLLFRNNLDEFGSNFVANIYRIPLSLHKSVSAKTVDLEHEKSLFVALSPSLVINFDLSIKFDKLLMSFTPSCLNIIVENQLYFFPLISENLKVSPQISAETPAIHRLSPHTVLNLPAKGSLLTSSFSAGHPILVVGDELNSVSIISQNIPARRVAINLLSGFV